MSSSSYTDTPYMIIVIIYSYFELNDDRVLKAHMNIFCFNSFKTE